MHMAATARWDFTDTRVLITGGAAGIGLSTAEEFVRSGADVVIFDRAARELGQAVEQLSAIGTGSATGIECDLGDGAAIVRSTEQAVSKLGGIDVLVNNAGVGGSVPLIESTDDYIDLVLRINLRAVILLSREVVKQMLKQGSGSIINVASQAARRGFPDITHYSASKAGVLGFTISLAIELAPKIRVNAINPGMVATAMMENNVKKTSADKGISYEEAYKEWTKPIPLARMQQPADVARAILFLASSDAGEITGETMNVNGGLVMW
jgi:NAD(P)-dependent dehydrogenase (short-subunit alcohol dehydrogenase family)